MKKKSVRVCLLLLAGFALQAQAQPIRDVQIQKSDLYDYSEDPYVCYGSGYVSTVQLGEAAAAQYPALSDTLGTVAAQMQADFTAEFDSYTQDNRQYQDEGAFQYEALLQTDVIVRRADEQVFSFLLGYQMYAGGAHGYHAYTGYQYDAVTGQEIALTDVVADCGLLTQVLNEKLVQLYPEWAGNRLEDFGYGEDNSYPYIWVLGPQGITVFFNPYEIAAYAAGILKADILFDEEPELFTGRYGKAQGAYAYQLLEWPDECADLDGDGDAEKISIGGEYDEYGYRTSLSVSVDDRCGVRSDLTAFSVIPVLMHTEDGRMYLYADVLQENDYHCIEVFDLQEDTPVWIGEIPSGIVSYTGQRDAAARALPTDPSDFILEDRINMFSSYNGQKHYRVGGDGMAEPVDAYFAVTYAMPLKTVKDLPAEALDPDTLEPSGEDILVPAGEELTIVRTDALQFADMRRTDGSMVRVSIDEPGWPRTIAGEDEGAYFEMMYYAG